MKLFFISFLFVVNIILFFAHIFIYKHILSVFPILENYKPYIIVLFIVLFSLFFVGNFLLYIYPSKISYIMYNTGALWLGIFWILFMVTVLSFSIGVINNYFHLGWPLYYINIILYTLAIFINIYAIYNGANVKVTYYKVHINNLSEDLKNKRAILFADTHYGAIYNENNAKELLQLIQSQNPDILFMAGDFYDGPKIDFTRPANVYKDYNPKLGKYFVSGNHEEYAGKIETMKAIEDAGFIISDNNIININGLQIVGIPYKMNRGDNNNYAEEILNNLKYNKDMPSIILKHVPLDLDVLVDNNASLILSGHTHNGQMWPFNLFTKYIYKGLNYGLNNVNNSNTQIITTSGAGSWGPPQRLGTKPEIVVIDFY